MRSLSTSSDIIESCRFCSRIARICIAFALFMCCVSSLIHSHLVAFVLVGDHDARGEVGDADRGLRLVHVLTALPARAVRVDAQVLRTDQLLRVLHLR